MLFRSLDFIAWVLIGAGGAVFFKRDSRMMYHLIKRRGFMPLDEYVQKYPETNRAAFAPVRPVYLPLERTSLAFPSFVEIQGRWLIGPERRPSGLGRARASTDAWWGRRRGLEAQELRRADAGEAQGEEGPGEEDGRREA